MSKKTAGFTLIELIIVVVIIAILAAISLVTYRGITDRAHESTVQSDLSNARQKLSVFWADEGRYPVNMNELQEVDIAVVRDSYDIGGATGSYANFYYCTTGGDGDSFSIGARSKGKNQSYVVTSGGGVRKVDTQMNGTRTCDEIDVDSGSAFRATGMNTTGGWLGWVGSAQ